jgi:hypothetical protein
MPDALPLARPLTLEALVDPTLHVLASCRWLEKDYVCPVAGFVGRLEVRVPPIFQHGGGRIVVNHRR